MNHTLQSCTLLSALQGECFKAWPPTEVAVNSIQSGAPSHYNWHTRNTPGPHHDHNHNGWQGVIPLQLAGRHPITIGREPYLYNWLRVLSLQWAGSHTFTIGRLCPPFFALLQLFLPFLSFHKGHNFFGGTGPRPKKASQRDGTHAEGGLDNPFEVVSILNLDSQGPTPPLQ